MAFNLKHTLIIFAFFVVIMHITKGQDKLPRVTEEEDDSSSEETVEVSIESHKRRRRSLDTSVEETNTSGGQGKANALPALPSIPGLPNPETILKIAEILTTVGQQVLPVLVSGNSGDSDFIMNRRISHDMKF